MAAGGASEARESLHRILAKSPKPANCLNIHEYNSVDINFEKEMSIACNSGNVTMHTYQ